MLPRLPVELLLECLQLCFSCSQQLFLVLGLLLGLLEPMSEALGVEKRKATLEEEGRDSSLAGNLMNLSREQDWGLPWELEDLEDPG